MKPPASNFGALDSSHKREVHLNLCRFALERWESYVRAHSPITYKDSGVGMSHVIDEQLPRDSFESSKAGCDRNRVAQRYAEPILAMQDADFAFPENIAYAYYAIYSLFRKYVQREEIEDWLIVNQSLFSEEDTSKWTQILSDAIGSSPGLSPAPDLQ